MPIYGFTCQACHNQFDRLQKLSDPDPDTCPECGAHAVKRQVSAPNFRLAGSGWYETDFKSKGEKRRNLADDSSPAGSDKGSGADSSNASANKSDTEKSDPGKTASKSSSPAPATE